MKEHSMQVSRTAIAAAVALTIGSAAALARDNSYVDSMTIRQVQQTLRDRGFNSGPIDGIMGPATRAAVQKFQQSQNLENTGQLNRQTLVALGVQPDTVSAVDRRASAYGPGTIRKVQQTLNNRGFQAGPADGVIDADFQAALREFQKSENLEATGMLNQRTLAALGLPAEPTIGVERRVPVYVAPGSRTVRDVQRALAQRGYDPGPVDGVMGPATKMALRSFQRAENLEPTGKVNARTLAGLGLPAEPTVSVEQRMPIVVPTGSATVREAQRALNGRGFQAGAPDGVMGPSTQIALRSFQESQNLQVTGFLDRPTLEALGIVGS
jgi:peptidoglycan hydrolase-like protein with peptidoglycan-binding domain